MRRGAATSEVSRKGGCVGKDVARGKLERSLEMELSCDVLCAMRYSIFICVHSHLEMFPWYMVVSRNEAVLVVTRQ